MITPDNILSHEFIGIRVEIIDSSNTQVIGLNGRIENETKSMFQLNTDKGMKNISKSNNIWKLSINDESIIVDGNKISKRPQDRVGGRHD
jgi:ribonuclease P protein subunit POP4